MLVGDLDEAGAKAAAADIAASSGARVEGALLDVSDEASVVATADKAKLLFGGIDVWVNNAGIFPRTDLLDMTTEQWDKVLSGGRARTWVLITPAGRRALARELAAMRRLLDRLDRPSP